MSHNAIRSRVADDVAPALCFHRVLCSPCSAAVGSPCCGLIPAELKTHIDDEYARMGVQDPRILLTTSRDPSSRLTQFLKELRLVFPNSQRINRGNAVIKELIEAARTNDFSDVVIVHEVRLCTDPPVRTIGREIAITMCSSHGF